MQLSPLLIPDSTIMFGYSGGMALYVSNWESVTTLFTPMPNEFVIAYEKYYSIPLN